MVGEKSRWEFPPKRDVCQESVNHNGRKFRVNNTFTYQNLHGDVLNHSYSINTKYSDPSLTSEQFHAPTAYSFAIDRQ